MNCPPHIYEKHWQEWLASAVDPEIIALNLVSLNGQAPYEYLFYSEKIKRLNTGRLPGWILKRYAHIEEGGWWCSGVDPSTGEDEPWGCFKPDSPRIDPSKGRFQKYEHPLKAPTTAFFLRVTWGIGLKIARRSGLEDEYRERIRQAQEQSATQEAEKTSQESSTAIGCNGHQSGIGICPGIGRVVSPSEGRSVEGEAFSAGEDKAFWQWLLGNPQVEITKTEGAKKAAALLSQGFAAIGLPGIWGGYRKNAGKPCLLAQLEAFAKGNRQFYFAFDQDEKRSTRQSNRKAIWHTAKLLRDKDCNVSIIEWEPWIKGVDDLIVAKGRQHLIDCYQKALAFDDWIADGLKELSYKPALRFDSNSKYLGEFTPPPNAKLICIKAPKASGKTEYLVNVCADAQNRGQKVLVLTHRTQLGKALCDRFGVDYVDELGESTTKGVFGIGLCFDSLRQNSRARFDPEDWHGCIVILDEVEQSIWHLLNAKTEVAKYRVQILRNFQQLIQNVLESGDGRVYLSDADLSDLSIDYVRSLVNFPVEPWIAVKEGNPTPWNVTVWGDCKEMLGVLESRIRAGEKPLIFVDGQKTRSKWGTQNLEAYLSKEFPDLKTLRVDAESVSTPGHPAYDCIGKLDDTLKDFDICIASPTIETGVSIDIKGHFTSVWDFAQGVIPVPSVLQRMARLREPVPRHVWAKGYGLGRIGNGATSPKRLMAGQETKFKAHVKQLVESEFVFDFESVGSFQPQSLRTWVKMAARINSGMVRYQHEIVRALVAEGHHIELGDYEASTDEEAKGLDQIKEELTQTRDKSYEQECYEISQAPTPDSDRLKSLQQKKAKSLPERLEQRKGELSDRYDESLVSSELVELDDKGEFPKATLHYYLTEGEEFLSDREKTRMEGLLQSGDNELFTPDVNRSLIGGKLAYLKALGVDKLLAQDTEWSNESQLLIDLLIKTKQFQNPIKDVLGISFNFNRTGRNGQPLPPSPISVGQKYLRECLGLKFSTPIKRGAKGNQQRYYQPVAVPELRQKVLSVWRERDEQRRATKLAEAEAAAQLAEAFATPQRDNGDLGLVPVEENSVTVGSTGNYIYIETTAYQNAAYQGEVPTEVAAYQSSAVEELVEALPFCETPDDFASIAEGYPVEVVEDAIALQPTQPRRQQLSQWYAAAEVVEVPLRPRLEEYQPGQQVWGYFPQSEAKWLKATVQWVRDGMVKITSGFLGMLIEREDAIAPSWYQWCGVP